MSQANDHKLLKVVELNSVQTVEKVIFIFICNNYPF